MESDHTLIYFGEQLKIKREAMGLSLELIASHLKLSKRTISDLEQSTYTELPISFIKGYLRSYAQYLQFSDEEIRQVLENLPVKSTQSKTTPPLLKPIQIHTKSPNKLIMRGFTSLLTATLIALSGAWWYNQANPNVDEIISGITSEQTAEAQNQAHLFLQVLNTLQNPKQNFTSIPTLTHSDEQKTVALKKNSPPSVPDEEEDEDTGIRE